MTRILCLLLVLALGASACASPSTPGASTASPKPSEAPATKGAAPASPVANPPTTASPAAKPVASPYVPGSPLNPPVKVKIGMLKSLGESPLAIARDRGYFTADGLDQEYINFSSTADALAPLATGELDVATVGLGPALFNAVARGVTIQIVGDGGGQAKGHDWIGVAVRNDHLVSGRYKTAKDLKGMKVGIPAPYATVHYMLKVLLEQNSLSLKDVETVPLGNPDMLAAMANKAVDAVTVPEPFLSQIEQQGSGKRVVGSMDVVPDLGLGIFLMSPKFPERNREAADRFMISWLRGVRVFLDAFDKGIDRDAVIEILRKNQINYVPNVQIPTFDPNGRFKANSLQPILDWYIQEGVVKEKIDLSRVADFSLVDRAAQRLGPYQ